jgi:small subunit ribosomal protein S2
MAPYLFGQRNKIHIINLEKSLPMYNEAVNFIGKLAARKGKILFVGTKRSAQKVIQEEALRCGMPFVNRRWLGGLLTNYKTVKQSINRMKSLEEKEADGTLDKMTKKDQLRHRRDLEKLSRGLSGIKDMGGVPDALFVIDVGYESIAVSEAKKLGIPVIGVVDSNNSPKDIDYIIPGNDDAIRSIRLYAKGFADAVMDSRAAIAHVSAGEEDDFVELDESGEPIIKEVVEKSVSKKTPVVKKRVSKKRTIKKKAAKAAPSDAETKADTETTTETEITGKTEAVDSIDDASSDEKATEATAPIEAKVTRKKVATKKTAVKKKTKKKVAKKAAEDEASKEDEEK